MVPAFPVVSAVIRVICIWPSDVHCRVGRVYIYLVLRNDQTESTTCLPCKAFDLT